MCQHNQQRLKILRLLDSFIQGTFLIQQMTEFTLKMKTLKDLPYSAWLLLLILKINAL